MKPRATATHKHRIDRLDRLLVRIPPAKTAPERCPDAGWLLERLADEFGRQESEKARRRMVQRDLTELVADERIAVVNPGGKPLRYRRVAEARDDDPEVLAFTREQVTQLVAELVPEGRLDALWRRLMLPADEDISLLEEEPVLNDQQLRILAPTQRLLPATVATEVLRDLIMSVSQQRAVQVDYVNNAGEQSQPTLHPQALVQRGSVIYLVAFKEDETERPRFYKLHRISKVEVSDEPACLVEDFDLDQAIETGLVDFGPGTMIDLELRARGYLANVLRDCPLAEGQVCEPEPAGSDFKLRLRARVPSSGALMQWLMSAGDKLEVLAPTDLRHAVAVQAAKVTALYADATN